MIVLTIVTYLACSCHELQPASMVIMFLDDIKVEKIGTLFSTYTLLFSLDFSLNDTMDKVVFSLQNTKSNLSFMLNNTTTNTSNV